MSPGWQIHSLHWSLATETRCGLVVDLMRPSWILSDGAGYCQCQCRYRCDGVGWVYQPGLGTARGDVATWALWDLTVAGKAMEVVRHSLRAYKDYDELLPPAKITRGLGESHRLLMSSRTSYLRGYLLDFLGDA
ncbi:hypothetical protein OH77DRAFT_876223 [Trametes cingulata]|nr:hypothetical protein OH77DRAFT_876223 [Trametes cingulata]